MTFRQRQIHSQFAAECALGFDNLVVSGCSFTYNNSEQHLCAWPYYLRDLGSFKDVYDCSLPGAGNLHIAQALQWSLLNSTLDRERTLVVVMWSGHDRDDAVMSNEFACDYPMQFEYAAKVFSAISGGAHAQSRGNIDFDWNQLRRHKTPASRAIENYLIIQSLDAWLRQHEWTFVFLRYLNPELPHRGSDFDIRPYLTVPAATHYDSMIAPVLDPYGYCVAHDLLDWDDFHPSPDGHLSWTREILLPYLRHLNM